MSFRDRFRSESRALAMPERRDPTAATTQLRWHGKGAPQVPDWNAEQAIKYGYLANVVAYRCMTIIGETIAAQAFRAGLAPPERRGLAAEFNLQSRLARLLGPEPGSPNPEWSSFDLWSWSIVHRLATGRFAWEIETTGQAGAGNVVALWPLVAANLEATPSERGNRYFSGYRYGRRDDMRDLAPAQVLYGWNRSHNDPRQATAPLEAARYALSIALASDQHQYGFLKNGAVPEFIVGVQAFETDEHFEAFKRQWNGDYRGPEKSGKTHFVELDPDGEGSLSESLFIQTVGMSAKDGRIPEQYMTALQQIAIDLGVPWSKLDASGRTFDNAKEEDRSFWQGTLLPIATRFESEVNRMLAPRLGGEVGWFDLSDVPALQPIPPASASEIPALILANVITPDEARPWLGLQGPAPEIPTTVEVPDAASDDEPGAVDGEGGGAGGAAGRGRAEAGRQEEAGSEEELRATLAKLTGGRLDLSGEGLRWLIGAAESRATVDQEARRGAIWRATDQIIQAEERRWARAWRRMFARQEKSVVSRLEGNARSKRWAALAEARAAAVEVRAGADGLFDPGFWTVESNELARDLFEQLAAGAFARLSSSFGVSFDLESEFAQLFITSRANQLAGQVTQTTYAAITDALAEGVGAGDGIPALADRIRGVFAEASELRATTIARTEVISGHNAAALSAASSLPGDVVAAQQWIATRDGRTRATHAEADGQVVAVGHAFSVAGIGAAYPGDPALPAGETVNCRCTVAFLTPDEFVAEADLFAASLAQAPVPVGRARVALALVSPGEFDEQRFRRALEVAA